MKKLIILALAACLLFVGVVSFSLGASAPAAADPTAALPTPDPSAETVAPGSDTAQEEEEAAPVVLRHVDLEAVHGLYEPDSVYAVVGEREITWGEYYQWLGSNILSAESYMESMAAYGMPLSWESDYSDGVSFADYVIDGLNDNLRIYFGIDAFAAANGLVPDEQALLEHRQEDIRSMLGEEATEEEWAALLVENFLTEDIYRTQTRANLEVQNAFEHFYGSEGEKLSEEELQAFLTDKGYLRSNHILFLTVDMETGEALDEEAIAAKKAEAERLAAELQAIDDPDELLARFAALKEELDEDTGKLYYPDGYVFTPGRMVPEFEETSRELEVYQVSDPVLTDYGYHVILRLPITADTPLDDGSSIGYAAANEAFGRKLDEAIDALDFSLAPGAERINLPDFLVDPPTE